MRPWNKGLTKETDVRMRRISEKKMGDMNPAKRADVRKKMSDAHKGKVIPLAQRLKHSAMLKGKKPKNFALFSAINRHGPSNVNWRGDAVGYSALHTWVRVRLGTSRKCDNCNDSTQPYRSYQWANISGYYKRLLSDWRRLCVKCHVAFDRSKGRIIHPS